MGPLGSSPDGYSWLVGGFEEGVELRLILVRVVEIEEQYRDDFFVLDVGLIFFLDVLDRVLVGDVFGLEAECALGGGL